MAKTKKIATSAAVLAAAGLLGGGLTACSGSMKVETSKPAVSSDDLQKDLTDRLAKSGNPAQSVTCKENLTGEVGKTAKCDVVFSETNAVEAVFTATKVEGTTVSYEIAPELTKEQLQNAVSGLTSTPTVSCDSGLEGKAGATAKCEVTKDGVPSRRTVEVAKVEGLSMDLNVIQILDKKRVAEVLSEKLGADGPPPETVECVDDVMAQVGSTVECTATSGDQTVGYIVEVTEAEGDTVNFDYQQKP
ncbi:MAG: DUF4333 domain-containing protein [Mycobacterium sp.]|nr:DUF4333 domain-containing protein [Mycobacterium sp.]